jgi:hypothetical protein
MPICKYKFLSNICQYMYTLNMSFLLVHLSSSCVASSNSASNNSFCSLDKYTHIFQSNICQYIYTLYRYKLIYVSLSIFYLSSSWVASSNSASKSSFCSLDNIDTDLPSNTEWWWEWWWWWWRRWWW